MRKKQFLNQLENRLNRLPEEERREILRDYDEHFRVGEEAGKSEEEIVRSLGDPSVLAKELLADHRLDQAEAEPSALNWARAVIVIVSLSFFNIIVVLGPFLALVGTLFALYFTSSILIFTPIIFLAQNGLPDSWSIFLQWLFASMLTAGSGVLLLLGLLVATRFFYNWTLRYLRFNYRVITGKEA